MIAISTAFKEAQIGVEINNKLALSKIDSNCKHSENVLVELDGCLEKIGANLKDNDFFAVVEGPGSFTGLRISAALVKGFCAGLGVTKIVPISSFELIADEYVSSFAPKENFLCIINALSGKYFVCQFDMHGNKTNDAQILTSEELEAIKFTKVGLNEENIGDVKVTLQPERLLGLAKRKAKYEKFQDVDSFSPVYLRKSQAEDNLCEKITKN